ncbi:MAG: 50S ribosomal protein L29 [Candidatus Nitrotoga sp.]
MKAIDLRLKSITELDQELLSLTKAKFSLRMQVATQELSNNSQINKIRRDIARVKTILTEKGAQ